ncbi:nuclear transport factor 2 family protein [Sphingomonas arantia]|uniref:Nuclear transport factor 2 family protein n=1 Tax=Sphingomonas arantia TaxID=1460676 RepID=A0ABW4TYE7_9SPHN
MTRAPRSSTPSAARVAFGVAAASLGLLAFGASANARIAAQNKTDVINKFEAWKAGTGTPFELLADDASWTIEGRSVVSRTYPTKEDFLTQVIRPFNARMSVGIKPDVRSVTAEDDRVVILFDARGTTTDGTPYFNSYAWFFRMEAGQVIEANAFFDAVAFNDLWSRITPV